MGKLLLLQGNRKNLYMECTERDLLTKLRPAFDKGGYYYRPGDGLICRRRKELGWNTPWIHVKHDDENECDLWHLVVFDGFKMLPPGCMQCYKIVIKPKSFRQMILLYDVLYEFNQPSKLGFENRPFVDRLWGAYVYNRGLKQGRANHKALRSIIDRVDGLGPEVEMILKRGCTEFEQHFGPSDEWDDMMTDDVKAKAAYIASRIEVNPNRYVQPEDNQAWILLAWFHWAHSIGDLSYVEYNNGERLFPTPVTYHDT